MLQAVVLSSKKQFQITQQGDAVAFLSWLLNALHLSLGGTKKADSSVIYKVYRVTHQDGKNLPLTWFWRMFLKLLGRHCSYLLPRQDG